MDCWSPCCDGDRESLPPGTSARPSGCRCCSCRRSARRRLTRSSTCCRNHLDWIATTLSFPRRAIGIRCSSWLVGRAAAKPWTFRETRPSPQRPEFFVLPRRSAQRVVDTPPPFLCQTSNPLYAFRRTALKLRQQNLVPHCTMLDCPARLQSKNA
jgi:hypothetical protein